MVVQNYRLNQRLEVALCGDGVDIVNLGSSSNCGHSSIFLVILQLKPLAIQLMHLGQDRSG